ncbi:MAG TPA: hypothetical protein RMH99_29570 [Sandaracinaceae bacterium LLY-WYZ-13_1]|nr:hypothetical protein [Sandaracinaceae bacterium LLY-WYZ-13_1]
MRSWGRTFGLVWALGGLASCGGATATEEATDEPAEESATTSGAETAEATAEDVIPSPPEPWAEMSADARQAWMFSEVSPRMEALFQSHDTEAYADFGCASCHGEDASERGYAMPSPSLPALHATGTPEQEQMVREYPEMVRFMYNDVLPAMQTLLGAPDYDEATGEGFSCFACHPHAGDEGTTPVELSEPPGGAPDAG